MCKVELSVLSHVKPGQGQAGRQKVLAAPHGVASWMPKCRGPCLCRLTDMFTPDRKCRVDGLPKQRGSKVRGASVVIYLSAENASRVQPDAGHASVRKKTASSHMWHSWTTWQRQKKDLTWSERKEQRSQRGALETGLDLLTISN